MFKQLHINITLVDALILIPKYHKMLKALLSNKEKLLEMENTLLNENCSAVIVKKLPEKLGDPGKFLIPYGFSELKCKALADLGASINLMPLSVWKKLVKDDIFDPEGGNVLIEKVTNLDSTKDLPPYHNVNPLGGSTTSSSSPNHLFEKKWILKDLVDEDNLADLNDNLADTMSEMFTDEHALDYSSSPLYDEYDNDLFVVESDTEYVYNDPFDSKGKKIKESKLLINELDLPRSSDFLPSSEYDSFLFEDFSKVDALPLTDNEDKVFNLGILIQKNLSEVNTRVTPDKNVKKIAISHASLILEDFDPPLYELPFLSKVLGSETLLSFSFKNEEKVFKPRILTSKGVHFSLLLEISHRGLKVFKIIKILKSPMEVFPCFCGEDIRILDVPCLHLYPP
nr:reverse transcriptase domain-containing protein [Tanacetum cinerariifolium]